MNSFQSFRAKKKRAVPSTAVANRFSSLATESDDEQDLEDAVPPTVPASDFAVRQMLSREIHMVGIDSRFIPWWLHADSALCVTGSPSGDGPEVATRFYKCGRCVAPSPVFARGVRASNRFFSLATESEDEQTPAPKASPEACPETAPVTQVDPGDSHDHRLARVGHAMNADWTRGIVKSGTQRISSATCLEGWGPLMSEMVSPGCDNNGLFSMCH